MKLFSCHANAFHDCKFSFSLCQACHRDVYKRQASLDYHILLGLSRTFFKFFQLLLLSSLYIKKVNNCSSQQLVYFIISFCLCQQVFSFFFIFYLSLQSPAIHLSLIHISPKVYVTVTAAQLFHTSC